MDTAYIPLAQAIGELRTEILAAIEQSNDEELTFDVETIDLELQVVSGGTMKTEAGGSLWGVLTLKGAAEGSKNATHKVKLSLRPQLRAGGKVQVSDEIPSDLS